MRGRKDIHLDAKGFDKNPQNINRSGANRKTLSVVNIELEAAGYSEATANDIKSCYLRLINIDVPELRAMAKDETQPALVRIVGKAIISGKGFDVIESMLNRSIGKATSHIDIKSDNEKLQFIDPFSQIRQNAGINEKTDTSD
jgi:hypothetical protein